MADKLTAQISTIMEQDRARLRDLFDESDYPSPEQVRDRFSMSWFYTALTAPKSLEAVSEELYASAREKMELNVQEASEAIRMVLRAQFKALVDHLVQKLAPSEDGKKKRIFESATDKIQSFLETFSARDITEDAELARLVQDAKSVIEGTSIEDLRTDENVRGMVNAGFTQIKEVLDTMVSDEPIRRIMLAEESDDETVNA